MRLMGLEAVYPRPNLSKSAFEIKKYPYLLRDVEIVAPNQVWSTDITYIPLKGGFLYLTAIMDWYTRYVLSWRISNTLDVAFCIEALEEALEKGKPGIFNTDQGCQYTSQDFTDVLKANQIQISMDGKGRALDNIFVERLWRTVKYEDVYIKRYENGPEAVRGLGTYMSFYNNERPHQSLGYSTPSMAYWGR
jgi:putative transposase